MQPQYWLSFLQTILRVDALLIEFRARYLLKQRSIALSNMSRVKLIGNFVWVVEILNAFVCRHYPHKISGRGICDLHPDTNGPALSFNQSHRSAC